MHCRIVGNLSIDRSVDETILETVYEVDRMSTVRKIARLAGVSPATVSRAINNSPNVAPDVKMRVMAAVNRQGYIPSVGKRSTMNIGFLFTGDTSIGSPFDGALMEGMADLMEELGFDLMILNAAKALAEGESFSQMFRRKGIRGAVVRTDARTRHLVSSISGEGVCAVLVGDESDDPSISSIHGGSRQSSIEAVQHLVNLGHRRVGVCVNYVEDTDHTDRIEGYRAALKLAGIDEDPRFIFRENARLEGGTQLARKVRLMPDAPTALYVADPLTAVGAVNEFSRLGMKIPEDMSIVGFDDGEIRFMTNPQLE
jgi:DNA-binding LacI/PurR family transcriptional regulator